MPRTSLDRVPRGPEQLASPEGDSGVPYPWSRQRLSSAAKTSAYLVTDEA